MRSFLIIQTAFIGDVILATSLVETIRKAIPDATIDFVLRKGNESLLSSNPQIRKVFVWNKQEKKYRNLFRVTKEIGQEKYDVVLNLQRFASTGFITWRSKAEKKIGFKKNPLSFFFTEKIVHEIGNGKHEIERNFELIRSLISAQLQKPKLYPNQSDIKQVEDLRIGSDYVVMAPSSVWFTKQMPGHKWVELISQFPNDKTICLIGAKSDTNFLVSIKSQTTEKKVINLAGRLNLLASAHLIQGAKMNYVHDSAPMHLASAMNAPTTVFFCSTVPEFGFGPISDQSRIIEINEKLTCRPCGLHGFKACPKGHFDCGNKIVPIP